ncbi:hypothetical protein LXA43DRAFT_970894 [Ganoderma leucocontextum]|nr:hypothetical protein LXA43DRAFT_970894 [Ganoderma leucocontextum]
MSISERLYIRWFPDEASETTSTLVLTAHNRQFVDLRLLKPADPSAPFASLEWGLAGRSVGTPSHGIWIHDIDSRTENPGDEKDEGDMFPQPEHPDVILERGRMRHPESGEVREYEEAWKDPTVLSIGGGRVSVVLETASGASGARGLVVRVGQFCQGILRVGSVIVVERWAWLEGGGWKLSAQVGDGGHLPCDVTWDGGLAVGDECSRNGVSWIAKEVRNW